MTRISHYNKGIKRLLPAGVGLLENQEGSRHQGRLWKILSSAAFGGLQGIDFLGSLSRGFLDVGSQIAVPQFPFLAGIGAGNAEDAAGKLFGPIAAIALFDDAEAAAPYIGAALRAHEITGGSDFQGGTVHGYHPLSDLLKLSNL
jgi:hypothetical protein